MKRSALSFVLRVRIGFTLVSHRIGIEFALGLYIEFTLSSPFQFFLCVCHSAPILKQLPNDQLCRSFSFASDGHMMSIVWDEVLDSEVGF